MSTPFERQTEISGLRRDVDALIKEANLTVIANEVDRINKQHLALNDRLEQAPIARYAYKTDLFNQLQRLSMLWMVKVEQAKQQLDQEKPTLNAQITTTTGLLNQLTTADEAFYPQLKAQLEGRISAMRQAVDAVERRIQSVYADEKKLTHDIAQQLDDVAWALEQAERAELALLPGENLFIACKAEWVKTGKGGEDPDGVLYLTNQRLLFEQSETKGKFLGLFGGKKVEGMLWTLTLADVSSVETDKKGLFGGKAMLTLTLTTGEPFDEAVIEVQGGFGNDRLAGYIQAAKEGTLTAPAAPAPTPTAAPTPQAAAMGMVGGAAVVGAAVAVPVGAVSAPVEASPLSHLPTNLQPISGYNVAQLAELGTLGGPGAEQPYHAMIAQIALSNDGSRLATRAFNEVRVWDVAAGTQLFMREGECNLFALSGDGAVLAVYRYNKHVEFLDASTGAVLHSAPGMASSLALSADGQRAAVAWLNQRALVIYRLSDGAQEAVFPLNYSATGLVFSPDGQRLMVSCAQEVNPTRGIYGYETFILDLTQQQPTRLRSWQVGGNINESFMTLSADERWLGLGNRYLDLHSTPNPDNPTDIAQKTLGMSPLLSADATLALVKQQDSLRWVDMESGALVSAMPAHKPYVTAQAISADGRVLVTSNGGSLPGATRPANPNSGVRVWVVVG